MITAKRQNIALKISLPAGVTAAKVYVKEVVQLNLKNVKIKSALI